MDTVFQLPCVDSGGFQKVALAAVHLEVAGNA